MLASHTTMIGEGFNPFDISMLNATHKRKGTVPVAKKSNPTNKRSTKTPAAPVQEVTVDVEAPTGNGNNIQQNNNNNKKAKPNNNNATYNIFDIDGIF
ncbi:hypothetical protein AGDE_13671 [Angomonas deanei]|uniref:Uncharacterized protein n=1 Tax=Angomonas deanei TaxID=59799 RepID=A0A7G2CM23_9TRYP|nr:hypothetical protein AGDE_13671 [Angomonas deanei]CAD2220107.1 hypothetical protein, conserved [Angomonas deanei]|eukprot:EPY21967.1 hypothetical protein AGDE_13671 [Angomonas deanei]